MLMSIVSKIHNFLLRGVWILKQFPALYLIATSGFFDKVWYLANNTDVANGKINPYLHYLNYGGFEGRDPGPNFNSRGYLETYQDVKEAGINPLIHYLRYGRKEGRLTQFPPDDTIGFPYRCPACGKKVRDFLPLSDFFMGNAKKYGYPYTTDDAETMNAEHYSCPHCGASDRDRLYACYLEKKMSQQRFDDNLLLLDIAPSPPLSIFITRFEKIVHKTADLLVEGVDMSIDITNMPEVASNSFDILICSHVLEHVEDDKKALSELYRVLKPGGWGIIMVPIILTIDQIDEDPAVTDVAERWRRFGQYDHVRLYSKAGFIKRVEAAGFLLKQLGVDYFGEDDFERYGITKVSVLYIVEKEIPNIMLTRMKKKCDFFFVIGTGRSGTTLMAQVLNAHSEVCVPFELQIIFETDNNGARLAEIFNSNQNLSFQAEDYIQLIEQRSPNHYQGYYDYRTFFYQQNYPILSLQWLLKELYTDIAYSQGKSIFGEQTPWYGQNIPLLNRLFPQAKFIHMLRDGRDVAISFARTPWWYRDISLNIERWNKEVNKIEQDGLRLLKSRLLTVRYEDLVLTPEKITRKVCEFLDISFEKTMFDANSFTNYAMFSKYSEDEVGQSSEYKNWKKEGKAAFFQGSVLGWKTNKEAKFDNISISVKQTLERYGYEI